MSDRHAFSLDNFYVGSDSVQCPTVILSTAMISLLGSVLEVIENLRPFTRRLVLIWVNCLEGISITHFFTSVILVVLCAIVRVSNFQTSLIRRSEVQEIILMVTNN